MAVQVDAHITYFASEGPLIKVYAQINKDIAIYIERLLSQLKSLFDTKLKELGPQTADDMKVGRICLTKFEDGNYYRARIESLQQYSVTVVFIDHGNKAQVSLPDIRLPSKLAIFLKNTKAIEILEQPGLASEFYLCGVSAIDKEVDGYSLDFLREKLCNKDFKCIVDDLGGSRILRFCEERDDPCALLVHMGKVHPIQRNAQAVCIKELNQKKAEAFQQFNVPPPVMQHLAHARLPNVTQPPPGVKVIIEPSSFVATNSSSLQSNRYPNSSLPPRPAGMTMRIPENLSAPPPALPQQFSTEMLAIGSVHKVYISHIEDGPYIFAVQLQVVVANVLTQMMADLNSLEPQPITAPLNPGSICLGRYSLDQSLCRAIVMNVMADRVKLYYADFGNSETLPYSDIYQIPPQFVAPKVMSHRFTLANIKDVHYTEHDKVMFKNLVATNSQGLSLRVTQPEANPLKQYGELFINCKNVKVLLSEMAQSHRLHYSSLSAPMRGSQEKVFVSFVLNPGKFFVQLEKNTYSLNQIMSSVEKHCRTAQKIPLVKLHAGEVCCALYEDSTWYRAEILNVKEKAFINFVDYGNQEEIEFENLRQTTPDLVTGIKAQALVCCLTGYETRYNVDEEVSNKFEELTLEKKLMMHVVDMLENNVLIVQLFDNQGQDIGRQLEAQAPQPPVHRANTASYSRPAAMETRSGQSDTEASPPTHGSNLREDKTYTDYKGPRFSRGRDRDQRERQAPSRWQHRDDGRKPWRSRDDGESGPKFNKEGSRWNDGQKSDRRFKDGEEKPWKSENRYNQDDSSEGGAGKYNREDSGGSGRFGRDDNRRFSERGSRFNDDDKSGRFGRETESRGGRFGEDRNSRFNRDGDGGGRYSHDTHDDKPFRKKSDNSTDWRYTKDKDDGGSWKDGDSSGGYRGGDSGRSWKDRDSTGGNWKDGDSSGSYRGDSGKSWKDRDSTGGNWKDGDSSGSYRGDSGKSWKDRDSTGGNWKDGDSSGGHRGDSGKSWKERDSTGGNWKDGDSSGGHRGDSGKSWKDRESSGGSWNKDREGGGDRKNRYDNDGGFKKSSYYQNSAVERSSFQKPWERGGGDSNSTPSPKPPKLDNVGGMPPSAVKVGSSENTQVVFTTSPVEFYVQLVSSFEELNQLMEKIATDCESGAVSDMSSVEEKAGCLAKYSEDDSWYRALVEEASSNTVKVLFVDYGNREDVSCDKIKELPEDMRTLPVQAIKCRLYAVPDTAETDSFTALVEGKSLKTQFVAMHFITKSFEVVMIDEENGSNINVAMGAAEEQIQAMSSKLGSTSLVPLKYMPGDTLTAQMTWYLSPAEFYLQPMDSNAEFRTMMEQMQLVLRSGTTLQGNQLAEGEYIIARFKSDQVLYRALVKKTGYVLTVQFVDYGNVESVDNNNVWAMEPQFATLPIQVFRCSLAGVQPVGDSWPKANTTDLDLLFLEADTVDCAVVRSVDEEAQHLVKLTVKGEDVTQKIIDAGFGTASSDNAAGELDTTLLVGQLLPVTLLRVEDNCSLFVQPIPEDIQLLSLETETGQGIKCCLAALREDATSEERAQLSQLPVGTGVIVHVDAVLADGLQVTVYDTEGQLMALQACETPAVAKICPMPVLNTCQRVWIAHASEDGIFLHIVTFADRLSELLQKLYEVYNESENVEQDWTEGELCCAYSINDEQWYRAKILETGDETKVQYLDYGNGETVPASNLRKLDASFYTPHTYALKVSFHVSWTVPVETLLELAGDTEYNAVILKSDAGWVAELVDSSGQSLTEKLVELGFAVALENSPFKRVVEGGRFVEGSTIPISVSFIDSPLQLWIHVGDDVELVEALQDRLQEAATKLSPIKEPSDIFAAKFSDGLWYRVVKLSDSSVRFIDYGNSDTVDMSDIKALSADFLDHSEGYAVKVELPVAHFTEGAAKRLEEVLILSEISSEEEITAHILSVKEDSIVADIFKGGKSVVDILVEENLGSRLQKVSSGFISQLNSPSDFFIQEVGSEQSLEVVSNTMLSAEGFEPVSQVNVNDVVAALFSDDGQWYRARVTKTSDDGVEVLFIDYGNSAAATEFRMLPSDLASEPPIAKHCTLQKPSGVVEWSESAIEKFVEMSADGCTCFEFILLDQEEPTTVTLTCNGKCVTEELKLMCDIVEQEVETHDSASIELVGYDKTVYISHTNSASDFYAQLEGAEVELNVLTEELAEADSFESLEQITDDIKEKFIGAKFVDDEQWYRAKILNVTEEGSEVLFVDYGNRTFATSLVRLPETLENKPPVAIHCALGNREWSEEANNNFMKLSGEGSILFGMKVLEEGEPNIVSLTLEGKIIEKELDLVCQPLIEEKDEVELIASDTLLLPNDMKSKTLEDCGIIENIYLIQVNSPSDFFLHTAEATQLVEEISNRLTTAEDFPPIDELSICQGKIVAAQFVEDDLWYRAKVIDHSDKETKVLFIDYGTTANVARMKDLPDDLLAIPAVAMHCSLQMLGCDEWSPKACQTFNKLANDDDVKFDLRIVSEGEPNVVILYLNGESVAEQLILVSGLVTEENGGHENEPLEITALRSGNEQNDQAVSPLNDEFNKEIEQENEYDPTTNTQNKDEYYIETSVIQPSKEHISQNGSEKNYKIVEISHFNDTSDFYVQMNDDKDNLMQVYNEMVEGENFEKILDIEEKIVAAQFTGDNLWYRAKILDSCDSGSSVLFVDYGNVDITKQLRKLPSHLAEMKPLAKHCCLKSPRGYWMTTTDEKLASLANIGGFTFNMKVLEEGDLCVVDFFTDDSSLSQRFFNEEMAEEQHEMEQSAENQVCTNLKKDSSVVSSSNSEGTTFAEDLKKDVEEMTDNGILSAAISSDNKTITFAEDLKKDVEEITDNGILSDAISSDNKTITFAEDLKKDVEEITDSGILSDAISSDNKTITFADESKFLLDVSKSEHSSKDEQILEIENKSPIAENEKDVENPSNELNLSSSEDVTFAEDLKTCDLNSKQCEDVHSPEIRNKLSSGENETSPVSSNTSNGSHEESIESCEEQGEIIKVAKTIDNQVDNDITKEDAVKTEGKMFSPPFTPQRSDIDRHIVPGCISSVIPDIVPGCISSVIPETSNGSHEESIESCEERGEISKVAKTIDYQVDNDITKEDAMKTEGKMFSPPFTPQRSDIDRHIVPGCISSVIPETSSEQP